MNSIPLRLKSLQVGKKHELLVNAFVRPSERMKQGQLPSNQGNTLNRRRPSRFIGYGFVNHEHKQKYKQRSIQSQRIMINFK